MGIEIEGNKLLLDQLSLEAASGTFSPFELFLQADIVVKAVMVGLLLASIWSWAPRRTRQ